MWKKKVMKNIKIVHCGIDFEAEREKLSSNQLQSLGIRYTRIKNQPYDFDPPINKIIDNRKDWYLGKSKPFNQWGLTSRHYGAWLSHKQGIMLGFADGEHTLVCESDCKILDVKKFKSRLEEAVKVLDKTEYPIVRFEKPNNWIETNFYNKVSENILECDNVLLGHCYLINNKSKPLFDKMYNSVGWHAPDIWLNIAFERQNQKQLCFNEELTHQFGGFSEIDKVDVKETDKFVETGVTLKKI